MKRVLLVAYFYPPLANSGTQRPLKFANYLPDAGWAPVVLTVADPPDPGLDPKLLDEVRPNTEVHRAPWASERLARRLAAVTGPFSARVADGLGWRLRNLRTFPDLHAWWAPTAIETAVALHAREPFDAIVATGYPWTAFLIGREVSRRTGKPWLADFRDAWTSDAVFAAGESRWRQKRALRLEERLLREADRVIAVTRPLAEHLRARGGPRGAAVDVIPNGYDAHDIAQADVVAPPPPGRVRIVYTGVSKQGYGPNLLYDVAQTLLARDPQVAQRLEIVTAGFAPGEAARRGLGALVYEHGPVSHSRALGIMQSADALFLPIAGGIHQRVQIPGKLYEYLASCKPVIVAAHPDGAAAQLVDEVQGGVLIGPEDRDALAALLDQASRAGHVALPHASVENLRPFERRTLAAQLGAALDAAVARRAARRA